MAHRFLALLAATTAACGGGAGDDDSDTVDAASGDAASDALVDAPADAAAIWGERCRSAEPITLPGGTGNATVSGTTEGFLDNYVPPNECTGFHEDGPDHVHVISIPAHARLDASVTPGPNYDAAIYLVATPAAMCDANPIVCLDGDDAGALSDVNRVGHDNTTDAPIDVFIIIDGVQETGGTYMLRVQVQ